MFPDILSMWQKVEPFLYLEVLNRPYLFTSVEKVLKSGNSFYKN